MASRPCLEADSPFDASPTSPSSATVDDDGCAVHRTAANRASGDHHVRIAQAVRAEEKLYRYAQTGAAGERSVESGRSGEADGRVQRRVDDSSSLWNRRQAQAHPDSAKGGSGSGSAAQGANRGAAAAEAQSQWR